MGKQNSVKVEKINKNEIELEAKMEELRTYSKGIIETLDEALIELEKTGTIPLMELYQNFMSMDDDITALNEKRKEFIAYVNLSRSKWKDKSYQKLVENRAHETIHLFQNFNEELNKRLISRNVVFGRSRSIPDHMYM
jgi:hypothetical protein